MAKCWICQINEANSGEHKFKASDIKRNFGKRNLNILYINQEINEIEKFNDDKLKFEKLICISILYYRKGKYNRILKIVKRCILDNHNML